jgi:hypothetical protein
MSAEPEKFHVSMIDFFSIILPGAVMTFYLRTAAEKSVMPAVFPRWPGAHEAIRVPDHRQSSQ